MPDDLPDTTAEWIARVSGLATDVETLTVRNRALSEQNERQATEIRQLDRRLGRPPRGRQIVQVSSTGVENTQSTQCQALVYALADDGTVWETSNFTGGRKARIQLPNLPAAEETEP